MNKDTTKKTENLYKGEPLTRREKEILGYLALGLKYKVIAQKIFISFETVKSHIRMIYLKLGVCNRSQAIITYYELNPKTFRLRLGPFLNNDSQTG